MSDLVLELFEISKDYRGLRPLRIERLDLSQGESVAILGLDQAGAEVFVNLVTGATLPEHGAVKLFGRPTRLPWALEIDRAHRPAGYTQYATFHPTFLYESLWCLLVFGTIVWLERRVGLRRGQAFALYVAMYTFGRIFFEWMRVDPASKIFGVRFNLLLSAILCVGATVWFVRLGRTRRPDPLPAVPGEHPLPVLRTPSPALPR